MRRLKPYLQPLPGDIMFTDQVDNKSAGWSLVEITAEQYLADVARYAVRPPTKFKFNPKKPTNYPEPIEPAPVLKKEDKATVKKALSKLPRKRKQLLKTIYTQDEVEAIAAASYLKGLKSVKELSDDEHQQQIIIAMQKANETRDEWNDYIQR